MDGVVCLDLPLNVVNPQRAVEMLGGSAEIARVSANAAYSKDPEALQLQLRDNRFHHPVSSLVTAQCKNIVIEVSIPTNCMPPIAKNRPDIRAGLAAAVKSGSSFSVTPKFHIDALYRFREIADFQYYCGSSRFLQQAETSLFQGNLAEIEKLSFKAGERADAEGGGEGGAEGPEGGAERGEEADTEAGTDVGKRGTENAKNRVNKGANKSRAKAGTNAGSSKKADKAANEAASEATDKSRTDIPDTNIEPQQDVDLLPPPRFSTLTQPFYYGYKQTPYLKIIDDGLGNQQLVHTVSNVKVYSNILTWGDAVPKSPPSGLEQTPRAAVQNCINELELLFESRPSYTRRWLQYYLGPIVSRYLKFALPYVAYYYRSGPWRGAYIKYGFDPSVDRELAQYQVEHFRITGDHDTGSVAEPDLDDDETQSRGSSVAAGSGTSSSGAQIPKLVYTFDGTKFPSVPMLQLKDICDGFIEQYVTTTNLRAKVDPNDGWYEEETATSIRRVLRAELVVLKESKPPLTNIEKTRIVQEAVNSSNSNSSNGSSSSR